VGFLIRSDQTYRPRTVLPEPGGATTRSFFSPAESWFSIICDEATWEGRSLPEKPILPKLGILLSSISPVFAVFPVLSRRTVTYHKTGIIRFGTYIGALTH